MAAVAPTAMPTTIRRRLELFFAIFDGRFEGLDRRSWATTVRRDLVAGLVVALTAIPMTMAFAMAMGLRPEQGIIAGALACAVGRTFGGSRYQVYGPTAALVPLVASLMTRYGASNGGSFASAHGMLVLVSIVAGVVLMIGGLLGAARLVKKIPASIIVGLMIGIAVAIAISTARDSFTGWWAFGLALLTFLLTRVLQRVSLLVPAPLVAIGVCSVLSATILDGQGISTIRDRFGAMSTDFFVFTPPVVPQLGPRVAIDVLYFASAIVFVSVLESLLSASKADGLANDRKAPFDADKETWALGIVQILTPLANGLPSAGALARTATSIRAGAVTPLAGFFKGALNLAIAGLLASQLERVPLACIAGILLWAAANMVKKEEVAAVVRTSGRFHVALMIFTAVMVPATDLLTAVLSALILFAVFGRFFEKTRRPDLFAGPLRDPNVRAVLARPKAEAEARPRARLLVASDSADHGKWLGQIRERPVIADGAYVHPAATIIGRVVIRDRAHIAADTSVRADEGSPFHIGPNTNIQDGVCLHALKDKRVLVAGESWAIYIGKNVSIAHNALVHGPCYIGDHTFVGFKAVIHDAVVGARCFVGIGAVVVGVEVPEGRFVPHGRIVDSPEAVAALPPVQTAQRHFNEDVVEVNRGLAVAYRTHDDAHAPSQADDVGEPPAWDIRWGRAPFKERF